MPFRFFHKSKDVTEGSQENIDSKPSSSTEESSIVFWCRRNKGSSSTAERMLELIEGGWNVPESDAEAIA